MLPLFYYQSYEYSQAHVTDLHVRIGEHWCRMTSTRCPHHNEMQSELLA